MSQKKQNKSTEDSTIEPVDNHDDNGSSGIADVLKVDTYFQLKEEARKAASILPSPPCGGIAAAGRRHGDADGVG